MMSVEEERQLGEKLLKMVESQVTLIQDPEVIAYVNEIGKEALQPVHGQLFDYRFFVVQDEGLNAFAMPGGLIFVHSGLLETIGTEDELVCVLAHEIGHVQGRHIARRIERMQKVNIATAAMAIAGLFLGSGEGRTALLATSGAINTSIALKYSREDEEEADRRAYEWICAAGYDPEGLIEVMKLMQRYRWLGTDAIPSYLSTHPASSARIAYLGDLLQQKPCVLKERHDEFRLRRLQVKTRILSQDPMPLVRRYRRELAATPKDSFLLYGLAQALLAAREYDEALRTFRTLVSIEPDTPEFRVDLGSAYFAAGRYSDAVSVLETCDERSPARPTAEFYLARSYQESGDAAKALPILKSLEHLWPDRPAIYLHLGRCLASLEKPGEAHYYFFLHYQAEGNPETALYHRNKALALLPPDSPLLSSLRAAGGLGTTQDWIAETRENRGKRPAE